MNSFLKSAAAIATAIVVATSAHATTFVPDFTYNLHDHPNGSESDNFDYGIRLDREDPNHFFTFGSGSNAILEYDVDKATAILSGSVFRSTGVGTTGAEYTLSYTLTGVRDLGGGFFVQETANSFGSLDLVGPTTDDDPQATLRLGTASNGSYYFKFANDGHRLASDGSDAADGISGRGWVQSDDGPNDFLFTGSLATPNENDDPTVAPLPAAGWMLLAGIGGIGLMRRRRKQS